MEGKNMKYKGFLSVDKRNLFMLKGNEKISSPFGLGAGIRWVVVVY